MYTGEKAEKKSDIDWEDPFFAAVKRSEADQFTATLEPSASAPPIPDRTTTTDYDIDQHTPV